MENRNQGNHQRINANKKYYIPVNGILVEVNEEVYRVHSRAIANERARARRDHKCGQADYRKCNGDCGHCPWVREGTNMLSYQEAFGTPQSDESPDTPLEIEDKKASLVEDIISERLLMNELFKKMDQLVPDGGRIVQMLMEEYSEREMASVLGVSSQSTINYRTRKIKKYLQEHWNDFFGKE